ncbi:hypothetical protein [Burkholderia ubonensis]|uniref:hypothetical protein n=1 Tax=Burkholderia ubonensis TaxID=101571 RepID=UPI0012F7B9DE|nr:hypothetical protein [Burkholderia ubonensis]
MVKIEPPWMIGLPIRETDAKWQVPARALPRMRTNGKRPRTNGRACNWIARYPSARRDHFVTRQQRYRAAVRVGPYGDWPAHATGPFAIQRCFAAFVLVADATKLR